MTTIAIKQAVANINTTGIKMRTLLETPNSCFQALTNILSAELTLCLLSET